MRSFGAALAAGALLFATACGGGDEDGRPSADDISQALQEGTSAEELGLAQDLPDDAADCIADVLVDSELSDRALRSIVDQDEDYKLSEKDEAALTPMVEKLTTCLKDVLPSGTPSS